jgi:hypothetical protein
MCTAGIPAITTLAGIGCGTPVMNLSSGFATVGAQTFSMNLQSASPAGAQAYLFLAEGSITAGVPVEGGHPCSVFLNLVSFANLSAFGYEPFTIATITTSNAASFAVPIPNDAALAGYDVTFQAAVIDPSGIPLSTVPGVGLKLSNALQIQIGS